MGMLKRLEAPLKLHFMLFNSYQCILAFLPIVLVGYFIFGSFKVDWAKLWLICASLVFYGYWRPLNVLIILPSIVINYGIAQAMCRVGLARPRLSRLWLLIGIVWNVAFLCYFKYWTFFEGVMNDAFGTAFVIDRIVLPLSISFITFQKIAFLADVHAGRTRAIALRDYMLFVLFFPQLIAGPIVHYREVMPQFQALSCRPNNEDFAVGLSLFSFGLFKKLVFADSIASYASPLYAAAQSGAHISFFDAWIAALGFTLQVYFDFSGYTDMALGLSRLFGIKLPANFNSPLKARSIIEFWQRWHMTLTRFLTAYIYNPIVLSLTRRRVSKGLAVLNHRVPSLPAFTALVAFPTLLTMLISGLWHGAGYTFILWGVLHGVLIVVNHGWRTARRCRGSNPVAMSALGPTVSFGATFLSVVFTMVLFRAPSVAAAWQIWLGMLGMSGASLPAPVLASLGPVGPWLTLLGVHGDLSSGTYFIHAVSWVTCLLAIALLLPNTLEIMSRFEPALGVKPAKVLWHLQWRPSASWAFAVSAVSAGGLLSLGQLSEFIYWQF